MRHFQLLWGAGGTGYVPRGAHRHLGLLGGFFPDLPSQSCGWAGLLWGLASVMPAQVSSLGLARGPGDKCVLRRRAAGAAEGDTAPTMRLGNLALLTCGRQNQVRRLFENRTVLMKRSCIKTNPKNFLGRTLKFLDQLFSFHCCISYQQVSSAKVIAGDKVTT